LLNFVPNVRPPKWMIQYSPEKDYSADSVWLNRLWEMGLPLSKRAFYVNFQVDEPEDDDDILPPPAVPPPPDKPPAGGVDPTASFEELANLGRRIIDFAEKKTSEDGSESSSRLRTRRFARLRPSTTESLDE
jgi:hypothetical protein